MESGSRFEKDRSNRKGSFHKTDWLALEEQLSRTRSILQEILVHLQGVLHNLRSSRHTVRNAAKGHAGQTGHASGGFKSAFRGAQARAGTCNSGGFGAKSKFQSSRTEKTFSGGESFRARPQGGFGAKAKPGGPYKSPFAEDRKTDFKSSSFKNSSKTFSSRATSSGSSGFGGSSGSSGSTSSFGSFSRERTRFESGAGGASSSQSRFQNASGQSARPGYAGYNHSAGAKANAQAGAGRDKASGHRVNQERQARGRAAARRGEMNLKSAYDILCLDYPCNATDIKSAYRNMARMYHPDLGGDEEMMKDVNLAYELAMRFCSGPRRTSSTWAV